MSALFSQWYLTAWLLWAVITDYLFVRSQVSGSPEIITPDDWLALFHSQTFKGNYFYVYLQITLLLSN